MSRRTDILRESEVLFSVGTVGTASDARLLEQFVGQPGATAEMAFETLVRRHGPMVLGVCRDLLRDPHAADDAFQATFLVLARKAGKIGKRHLLGNWLYGVALRTALKARAQAARRVRHERQAATMVVEAVDKDSTSNDLAELLHREVNRLPQTYRAAIVLCHMEGRSYAVAACQLGLTEDAVRGRLARARDILRDRLSRREAMLGSGLIVTDLPRRTLAAVLPGLSKATIRASMGITTSATGSGGVISARVVHLSKGVLRNMLVTKLKAVACVVLLVGSATIGVRAIGLNATQQPAAVHGPLQSGAGSVVPAAPPLLAAAGQARTTFRSKSPSKLDEALVRSVDGHIVGVFPIIKDCMVLSYMPDWAFGNVDNLGIANNDGGVRTLLNWGPISSQSAKEPARRFVIALYSRKTTTAGKQGPILVFEINEDWQERTSWKSQPEYADDPAGQFKFVPDDGWKLFDVTPLVRSQVEAGKGKDGVLLRWLSEDRSGQKRDWSGYQFVSREGPGEWESRRPLLLVVEPTKK